MTAEAGPLQLQTQEFHRPDVLGLRFFPVPAAPCLRRAFVCWGSRFPHETPFQNASSPLVAEDSCRQQIEDEDGGSLVCTAMSLGSAGLSSGPSIPVNSASQTKWAQRELSKRTYTVLVMILHNETE